MKRIAVLALLVGLVALATGAATADARLPAGGGTVDLLTDLSVRFDGAAGERSGRSLVTADFNGDGRPDLAIGVPEGDTAGRNDNGYVAVVANPRPTGQHLLPAVQAFRVDGAGDDDRAGRSLASPGDVNGDGIDDLLIGSGDPNNADAGYAAIVFGKRDMAAVDLGSIGNQGFLLNGGGADRAGLAVGGASGLVATTYGRGSFIRVDTGNMRDLNGDGLADFLVASPFALTMGRNDNGVVNVVYGKRDSAPVDLRNLGAGGYQIHGASDNNFLGLLGVAMGDVNGDGRPDLVTSRSGNQGAVYAVFGESSPPAAIDLNLLGLRGYALSSPNLTDPRAGVVGDWNGDGRDEVVIGAPMADNNGRNNSGAVIVAFGKSDTAAIDLANNFGGKGIVINGGAGNDQLGVTVATGDVNNDGQADVLAGAPEENAGGRNNSGAAYVIAGRPTPGDIDLSVVGPSGGVWKTNGAVANDRLGDDSSLGIVGDWDGDGRDDLGVAAAAADNNGNNSGSSYVVFSPSPLAGRCENPFFGNVRNNVVRGTARGENIRTGDGNDTISLGAGDDCGSGEGGNDRINGDDGNDTLNGGSDNDRLKGGRGKDRLIGKSDSDRLDGGRNRDSFSGGSGDDRILARDGVSENVNCGSGNDIVSADRRDRVSRNCEQVRRR